MKTTFNVSLTEMSTGCRKPIYFDYLYRMENFTDVLWCSVSSDYYFNRYEMLRSSYPTSLEGLYILSSNQRYLSPLEKIHTSFDFSLILGTIIISIITYSVILFTNSNRSHSFTTFEIIRLWIGVSLNTRINSLYLRIFFSLVFIYFLVMQMTLQGDFVDGLSKTKLGKNVNSLSDLRNNYYQKIFKTYDVDIDVFKYENIVKAKIPEDSLFDRTCVEKVIKDPSSVCIAYFNALLSELMRKKLSKKTLQSLHLSKYSIITRVRNYLIPDEWPLKMKFDKFLMSVDSSGINAKTEANILAGIISNLQTSEYVASFKPISLDSLYFFFFFWFVGITLSLICFFIEILDGSRKCIFNCIGDKEIILSV